MNPMTKTLADDGELRTLIEAVWNGTISVDERDRLESILAADECAQEFYLTCMALHARLLWLYRGEARWAATSTLPSPLGKEAGCQSKPRVGSQRLGVGGEESGVRRQESEVGVQGSLGAAFNPPTPNPEIPKSRNP